jgi:hypothetical protein
LRLHVRSLCSAYLQAVVIAFIAICIVFTDSRVVAAVLGDESLNNAMTNSTVNETSNTISSTITTLSNTNLTDDSVVANYVTPYRTTYTSNDTSNSSRSDGYWRPIHFNVVSGFDGASFVGGMLLSLAGMLIGFVAVNMYKRRMRYLSEYNNLS